MIYENSFKIYYCRYDLKSSAIKDVIFGILQAIVPFSMSIGYIVGAFVYTSDTDKVYYAEYSNIFA